MADPMALKPKEAIELCRDLPLIADRLMRAGLIQTAHRMREAIRSAGYETADLLEGKRRPVDRPGRNIDWRSP